MKKEIIKYKCMECSREYFSGSTPFVKFSDGCCSAGSLIEVHISDAERSIMQAFNWPEPWMSKLGFHNEFKVKVLDVPKFKDGTWMYPVDVIRIERYWLWFKYKTIKIEDHDR